MKKLLSLILALVMAVTAFAACGEKTEVSPQERMEMLLSESDKTPGYHTSRRSSDEWLNYYKTYGWEIVGFYYSSSIGSYVVYYVPTPEEYLPSISTENCYPLLTRVVALDYDRDIVTVEDANDFRWKFYGVEDWTLGDLCNLQMFDNYTSDRISDDVIVRPFYTNLPKEVVK